MCLSICLIVSIYLSFFLFLHLSYLILSYVILSISVSLSLFLFRSGYLSVYLQAGKRSYAARLPQFFNLKTSKTQQLSETVSIRELDGCRRVVRTPLFFFCTFDFEMSSASLEEYFLILCEYTKTKIILGCAQILASKGFDPSYPLVTTK